MRQEFDDITLFLKLAEIKNTSARTIYYKAAFNSMAAIIEAFIYEIVRQSCEKDPALLSSNTRRDYKQLHDLNKARIGTDKDLVIVERIDVPFTFKEVTDKFNTMNRFCRDNALIQKRLYNRIDRVRKKRNDIHLQTRTSVSRSYTRAELDRMAAIGVQLISVLSAIENRPN